MRRMSKLKYIYRKKNEESRTITMANFMQSALLALSLLFLVTADGKLKASSILISFLT